MENLEQEEEENLLDLSAISNDPEDEHEFPEVIQELEMEDTMVEPTQNESAFTDNESFRTISEFPLSQSNISDMSSLNLSELNSSMGSTNTTQDNSSFGGYRKKIKTKPKTKPKTKKLARTKKNRKSKKVRKIRATRKSKNTKTKKRRSATLRVKKRLRGGFIGDNGTDSERYGETNPYSVERDSDPRF
jgi:hypothetical protein